MSRLCQHASTIVTKAALTSHVALMSTRIYDCYYSSIDVTGRAYGNTHLRLLLKQHRRHRSRLCQHASTIVTKAALTSHVALMATRIYGGF